MKIVLSVALTLLFIGCSDSTKTEVDTATKTVASTAKKSVESVNTTATKAKETVVKTVEKAKETVEKAKEVVAAKVVPAKSGAELYKTCAGCHGQHGEKHALGKSQIIKDWSFDKIKGALDSYKEGSHEGAMRGIMEGQTKNLSDSDIDAVAHFIAKKEVN